MKKKGSRIYVCHTFYHVYISILKEFNLPEDEQGKADLVLSKLSTNFGALEDRIKTTGIFNEVFIYDEKRETFFPELSKYKVNRGSFLNLFQRVIFTKKFAKYQEAYVPVNFKLYKDIYVFSDTDPVGPYLSQHRIPFHAVEDGLNCLSDVVAVKWDNPKNFGLKVFMSDVLNLIYMQNGFNKYCIDMEVNDISAISFPCKKYKEVSRTELLNVLTPEKRNLLLRAFVDDVTALENMIKILKTSDKKVLLLTEHLCDEETRVRIFKDLTEHFSHEGVVFIKPHPRDELDYKTTIPGSNVFSRQIPMEIFNLLPDFHFDKVVGIFTPLVEIKFADEKESLGAAFMDKYEDPAMHERFVGVR